MLHASGLPCHLWAEAARHAVWLQNQALTCAIEGMTPFKALTQMKPNLSPVCEWGDKCWVQLEKGDKLGGRVCKGWWVGIDNNSAGSHIY